MRHIFKSLRRKKIFLSIVFSAAGLLWFSQPRCDYASDGERQLRNAVEQIAVLLDGSQRYAAPVPAKDFVAITSWTRHTLIQLHDGIKPTHFSTIVVLLAPLQGSISINAP